MNKIEELVARLEKFFAENYKSSHCFESGKKIFQSYLGDGTLNFENSDVDRWRPRTTKDFYEKDVVRDPKWYTPEYIKSSIEEAVEWISFQEKFIQEFGETECVCNERSSDGDHDQQLLVIHFKKDNLYLQITGSYNSNDGATFDYPGYHEVKPKQITTTVWESVEK